jgi:hypothetical protein
MSSIKKKIFINISDVASYIGQNKWDFVKPFERIWKKCDSINYQNILNNYNNKISSFKLHQNDINLKKTSLEEELAQKLITKRQFTIRLKELDNQFQETKNMISNLESKIDSIDLTHHQQMEKIVGSTMMESIQSASIDTNDKRIMLNTKVDTLDLDETQKDKLKKSAESYINKTHGTLKEDSAISMYENKFGVKLDTSQQFNKVYLYELSIESNYDWFLCGKVDGLYLNHVNPEESYIVEVKNRTKSFFSTLRDYEKTQIQLYMFMLNYNNTKLVEKYKDSLRITSIYKDDEYSNDVINYLQIFVKNFETRFLNSESCKIEFFEKTDDEKRAYLKKLYLNDITKYINSKLEKEVISENDNCMIDDLD